MVVIAMESTQDHCESPRTIPRRRTPPVFGPDTQPILTEAELATLSRYAAASSSSPQ